MSEKYTAPQIALHWLTALLLIVAYATMELRGFVQRGSWQGFAMIITHFSAGFCIMLIMLMRLVMRTRRRSPDIVPPLQRWQTGLSHAVHTTLYALFLLLPVLGITSRYLGGRKWWLFGVNMPVSAQPNPELARSLIQWHETLAPLGYWLIGLHAVAALLHHYLFKDNTLLRMMPSRRIR